jgi:hypothetical protein
MAIPVYPDEDGFYMDDPFSFDRASQAIVTNDTEVLQGVYPELAGDSFLLYVLPDPVDVRIQGVASGPTPLFIGSAASAAVEDYLDWVTHDEISGLERHEESKEILAVSYTRHEGSATPSPPGTQAFWATSVSGTGLQTLDWTIESGDWTAVVMNGDASSGVNAELSFGAAAASSFKPIMWTMMTVGIVGLIGGGLLVLLGLRRRHAEPVPSPADSPGEQASQPASLEKPTITN